jgi:hypothetical protein
VRAWAWGWVPVTAVTRVRCSGVRWLPPPATAKFRGFMASLLEQMAPDPKVLPRGGGGCGLGRRRAGCTFTAGAPGPWPAHWLCRRHPRQHTPTRAHTTRPGPGPLMPTLLRRAQDIFVIGGSFQGTAAKKGFGKGFDGRKGTTPVLQVLLSQCRLAREGWGWGGGWGRPGHGGTDRHALRRFLGTCGACRALHRASWSSLRPPGAWCIWCARRAQAVMVARCHGAAFAAPREHSPPPLPYSARTWCYAWCVLCLCACRRRPGPCSG